MLSTMNQLQLGTLQKTNSTNQTDHKMYIFTWDKHHLNLLNFCCTMWLCWKYILRKMPKFISNFWRSQHGQTLWHVQYKIWMLNSNFFIFDIHFLIIDDRCLLAGIPVVHNHRCIVILWQWHRQCAGCRLYQNWLWPGRNTVGLQELCISMADDQRQRCGVTLVHTPQLLALRQQGGGCPLAISSWLALLMSAASRSSLNTRHSHEQQHVGQTATLNKGVTESCHYPLWP